MRSHRGPVDTTAELDSSIGSLVLMRPKAVVVLREAGIPLAREHGRTLLDACVARGLDPDAVLQRLVRAERGPSRPEIEQLDVGACIRRALAGSAVRPSA